MLGSIDCLDDLLRAGITLAESVVVVNKELSNSAEEDSLSDCNTIVAVQNMFKCVLVLLQLSKPYKFLLTSTPPPQILSQHQEHHRAVAEL